MVYYAGMIAQRTQENNCGSRGCGFEPHQPPQYPLHASTSPLIGSFASRSASRERQPTARSFALSAVGKSTRPVETGVVQFKWNSAPNRLLASEHGGALPVSRR